MRTLLLASALALILAGCGGNPDPRPYDSAKKLAADLNEGGYNCDLHSLAEAMSQQRPSGQSAGEQLGSQLGTELAKSMLGITDGGSCGTGSPVKAAIMIYPEGTQSSPAIESMMTEERTDAYAVTGPNWQIFTAEKGEAEKMASVVGGEVAPMGGSQS